MNETKKAMIHGGLFEFRKAWPGRYDQKTMSINTSKHILHINTAALAKNSVPTNLNTIA